MKRSNTRLVQHWEEQFSRQRWPITVYCKEHVSMNNCTKEKNPSWRSKVGLLFDLIHRIRLRWSWLFNFLQILHQQIVNTRLWEKKRFFETHLKRRINVPKDLRNDFEVQVQWNASRRIVFRPRTGHYDGSHRREDISRPSWLILLVLSNICRWDRDIGWHLFPRFEPQPMNPEEIDGQRMMSMSTGRRSVRYFLNANTEVVSIFHFRYHQLNPQFDNCNLQRGNAFSHVRQFEYVHCRGNERCRASVSLRAQWSMGWIERQHWTRRWMFPDRTSNFSLIAAQNASSYWQRSVLRSNATAPERRVETSWLTNDGVMLTSTDTAVLLWEMRSSVVGSWISARTFGISVNERIWL